MVDVNISSQEVSVISGPSNISVQLGLGQQGQRGSKIFVGETSPELFFTPEVSQALGLQFYDMYINTGVSSAEYLYMYQFINQNGTGQWELLTDMATGLVKINASQTITGTTTFVNGSTAASPMRTAAIAGTTVNLHETTVGGTLVNVITASGSMRSASRVTAGSASLQEGQLSVYSTSATTIGAVVRGAASQSANLQEWQNSAGTVQAFVSPSGRVNASDFGGLYAGSFANLSRIGSTGVLDMFSFNETIANPGANRGRIYFKSGTTAGTLKLVVRAGAAGAETTILDNIPQ